MAKSGLLTLLSAFICSQSGCLAIYSTRNVDVLVTRTDTGEPAAGVPVRVHYLGMMLLNLPNEEQGRTDASGRVTLPMADYGPYLTAGSTEYYAGPVPVKKGGELIYKPSANPEEPIPTYSVRLIPRKRRTLAEFFFWGEPK